MRLHFEVAGCIGNLSNRAFGLAPDQPTLALVELPTYSVLAPLFRGPLRDKPG
jgi:hypothetical protein